MICWTQPWIGAGWQACLFEETSNPRKHSWHKPLFEAQTLQPCAHWMQVSLSTEGVNPAWHDAQTGLPEAVSMICWTQPWIGAGWQASRFGKCTNPGKHWAHLTWDEQSVQPCGHCMHARLSSDAPNPFWHFAQIATPDVGCCLWSKQAWIWVRWHSLFGARSKPGKHSKQ